MMDLRGGALRALGGVAWMAVLAAACCSCASTADYSPAARRSVADLPVEKFDRYLHGQAPPPPWQVVGAEDPGVSVRLDRAAESAFIGNTVGGVGVVIDDASTTSGYGAGLTCRFAPPPAEPVYVGVDFCIPEGGVSVQPTLVLSTGAGSAYAVTLFDGKALSVVTAEGTVAALPIERGQWYHVALFVYPEQRRTTLAAAMYRKGKRVDKLTFKPIDKNEMAYDLVVDLPGTLFEGFTEVALVNRGPAEATGKWMVDNVVMGGRIDVPRRPWWPFDRPSVATLRASDKKVFAYYYSVFSNTVSPFDPATIWSHKVTLNPTGLRDKRRVGAAGYTLYSPYPYVPLPNDKRENWLIPAMEMEVRLAREMGLDGFIVDFWSKPHPTNGQRYFIEHAWAMLEAVRNVDPGFKIIPAIYSPAAKSGVNAEADESADPHEYAASPVVRRALTHPSAYRLPDGRVVMSMWLTERHSVDWWKTVMAELKKAGIDVALFPQFNSTHNFEAFAPISYGMTIWGTRNPQWDYWWPREAHKYTKVVGTPIAAQDIRTRGSSLWEAENFDTLRSLWTSAIKHDATWAIIVSWNDFTEQAQMPSERVGFALHDLNAYYTTWFKTGKQPEVTRDVLYYSYRRQHSTAKHTMGRAWSFRDASGKTGPDSSTDDIELLAFLKRPGTLTVEAGGRSWTRQAEAGITSFKAPMPTEGEFRPVFTLERDGRVVLTGKGRHLVTDKINFPDLLYNSGVIAGDD